MRRVRLGHRVDDVPGICWTCDRTHGDLGQVLVFPPGIQAQLGAAEERFAPCHSDLNGATIDQMPSVPARLLYVTGICLQCKHGWVDDVDRAVEEVFPKTSDGLLDPSVQAVLAWWFARTTVLLNVGTNFRVLVPAEERWALHEGPPPGFTVRLAQMPNQPDRLNFAQGATGLYAASEHLSGEEVQRRGERVLACGIRVGDLVGVVTYTPPDRWAHPAIELPELFPPTGRELNVADLPVLTSILEGLILTNM